MQKVVDAVSEQLIALLFRPYFENFYRQLCATVKYILRNFLEIISSIKNAQTQFNLFLDN